MRSVDLEAKALRASILLGDEYEFLDSEIAQSWAQILALGEKARAPGGGSDEPALLELGRKLVEKPLREVSRIAGGMGAGTLLSIVPGNRSCDPEAIQRRYKFWLRAERLPFEVAADDRGFLLDRGIGVVRILGGRADRPLVLCRDRLRVLVVAASPIDDASRGLQQGLAEVREAIETATNEIPIDLVCVSGPGTWSQLAKVALENPHWDIVHVVAHGQRAGHAAEAETILVETVDGYARAESYAKFADQMCATLKGVRLFTLAVCNSSPLALELACRFPAASLVGLLSNTRQAVADGLFGKLFRSLLDARQSGETHLSTSVSQVVSRLKQSGEPEWFQAVTYLPAEAQALFDWTESAKLLASRRVAEERKDRIIALARSGQLDRALSEAIEASRSPDQGLAQWATSMERELRVLLDCEKNLDNLEEQLARECNSENPGWVSLHKRLVSSKLESAPISGVRVVPDDLPLPDVVRVLRDVKGMLETHFQRALGGLRDLAEYQYGKLIQLVDGCAKLMAFVRERRDRDQTAQGPLEAEALRSVVKRGIAQRFAQVEALMSQGAGGLEEGEKLRDAAAGLSDLDLVIKRATRELDGVGAYDRELHRWTAAFQELRSLAGKLLSSAASSSQQPPVELLAPDQRVRLIEWMVSEPPSAQSTNLEVPTTPQTLLERLQAVGRRSGRNLRRLPPALWTAIANLQFPIRPIAQVTRADDAFHPFLVLAGQGVDADAPMDKMMDLATAATGCADRRLRGMLVAAANQLTRDETRLLLDVTSLPCANPAVIARHLPVLAKAVLAGEEPRLDLEGTGIDAKDRLCLLVLAGQMHEAVALGTQLFKAPHPRTVFEHFEVLRAAYLALAHAAHVAALSQTSVEEFTDTVQRAAAALGMLLGSPEALATWVRMRIGFYRLVCPDDLDERMVKVTQELRRPLQQALDAYAASNPAVARQLSIQLETELAGARVSPRLGLRREGSPFIGGYLAARFCGCLSEIGPWVGNLYRRLAPMTVAQRMRVASLEGITEDLFHELVFSFCRLRLLGEAELRNLLSTDMLVAGELVDCTELLAAAEDFPMHAALPRDEAEQMLSAHIAIRLGSVARKELLNALGQGSWRRPRIKGLLEIVMTVNGYLARQGYRLGGEPTQGIVEVARLATEYLEGLCARLNEKSDDCEGLRKRGDEAVAFIELLQTDQRVCLQPDFMSCRTRFCFNFAIFLANECDASEAAFKYMKLAYEAEPDNPQYVKNFLLATGREAVRLAFAMRDHARAQAMIATAICQAEAYVAQHPDDSEGIRTAIQELRGCSIQPPEWFRPPTRTD